MSYIKNESQNEIFLLNYLKNIVRTNDGYKTQDVYKKGQDGRIQETEASKKNPNKNAYEKSCECCSHNYGSECLICTKIEKCSEPSFIPYWWIHHCDAYDPIKRLNIIRNIDEMITFICRTEYSFKCPEDYELYYGFQRRWDEETGDILETTREYYDRGGVFEKIPDKYPCVIYADFMDDTDIYCDYRKLKWICIGE